MSDDPRDWLGKRVECRYTDGRLHAVGEMIAYSDRPTVVIRAESGAQVSWVAHLTRLADGQEPEARCPGCKGTLAGDGLYVDPHDGTTWHINCWHAECGPLSKMAEEENHEAIVMAEMHEEEQSMKKDVPRRAAFDDLRVGQWVAYLAGNTAHVGPIARRGTRSGIDHFAVQVAGGKEYMIDRSSPGEVTILRDAPAPPVTVRREDYDALVALDKDWPDFAHAPIRTRGVIQDIIDNADTGTDEEDERAHDGWGR